MIFASARVVRSIKIVVLKTSNMKNFQTLKEEKQKRINQAVAESKMFFAFSDEQFEENKTPLKEGEKYARIGAGGFMPRGQR